MVRYFVGVVAVLGVGISGLMPAEASKPSAMTFPFIEPAADHAEVAVKIETSYALFSRSETKTIQDIAVARCTDGLDIRAHDKVHFNTPYNLGGEISESWQQDLELCAQGDASCTDRSRTMLALWKKCMNGAIQAVRSLKNREQNAAVSNVTLFPNS